MTLRPELPELPADMRHLPLRRGYPVPYFVAWLNEAGEVVQRGEGEPDFRVLHPDVVAECWEHSACWVCGRAMRTSYKAFVIGPMCAVNRTSAEPPLHRACAEFSAKGCPFLTRPHMVRREAGLPENTAEAPGIMLDRNPGVALLWITKRPKVKPAPNGILFDIGPPEEVLWFAEGRAATREEVQASIDSGLPALRKLAEAQGEKALRYLEALTEDAMRLLPA